MVLTSLKGVAASGVFLLVEFRRFMPMSALETKVNGAEDRVKVLDVDRTKLQHKICRGPRLKKRRAARKEDARKIGSNQVS